jgi:YD repeat-containing protein
MKTTSFRARSLAHALQSGTLKGTLCALLSTTAYCGLTATPAAAQDAPKVISPLRVETDHNGVNLLTGKAKIPVPVLSVPAAPNLTFDRVQNLAPYVTGSRTGEVGDVMGGSYAIHTGRGTSESFTCENDDVCMSESGSGSTFVPGTKRFTEADTGAIWNFDLMQYETAVPGAVMLQYYASSVSYPTGEIISYSYDMPVDSSGRKFYRPSTVSSNAGYLITITYHSSAVGTPAWDAPAQATLYKSSDPGTPLQRLTYSLDGTTITDLNNRVYTCQGCSNRVGDEIEVASGSFKLPGETASSLEVTQLPATPLVSSVVKDGVQWNYDYTNLRSDLNGGFIYDALTVTGPNGYNNVYVFSATAYNGGRPRLVINRATDSLNRHTDYVHDHLYRPTRMVLPEGNRVDVIYGPGSQILSRTATAKPNSGLAPIGETAEFPTSASMCTGNSTDVRCYRPTWVRDGLGRQTDYAYNPNGQVTEETAPADSNGVRRKTSITYESSTGISRPSVVRICGLNKLTA